MTVKKAEQLLRSCMSQGVLYWVVCCECNPPPPTGVAAHEIYKRAYERALYDLEMPEYHTAVAAIGLHSYSVQLSTGMEVRKASLALVERDNLDKEPFLYEMSGSNPTTHAHLVAEALKRWRRHKGAIFQGASVVAELALANLRRRNA